MATLPDASGFDVLVERPIGGRTITARFVGRSGITALFGPSGAGKTSVLNMVAGLAKPAAGRIVVGGTVLFDSAAGIDLAPRARRAGYVFQDLRLFPHLTVRENLLYGLRLAPAGERWMSLDHAVDFLSIGDVLGRWPQTLSGGEAQRVAIGRAVLGAPRFLLLDEPLSSVDHERREEILRVVERLRDELRLPMLYVSHDRAEVDRLADTVVNIGS